MLNLKVLYDDGDYTVSRFNGTKEDAEKYYLGTTFNLGITRDNLRKCVAIEFLPSEDMECESADCAYNHNGYCRYARVHDKEPTITEDDGCIDFVITERRVTT